MKTLQEDLSVPAREAAGVGGDGDGGQHGQLPHVGCDQSHHQQQTGPSLLSSHRNS